MSIFDQKRRSHDLRSTKRLRPHLERLDQRVVLSTFHAGITHEMLSAVLKKTQDTSATNVQNMK